MISSEIYRFENKSQAWEYRRPDLTEVQAAYIAGLIDGEGSVFVSTKGKTCTAVISVYNSDRRCLDFCAEAFQTGTLSLQPKKRCNIPGVDPKPSYVWRIQNRAKVAGILWAILPYLVIKKDRAEAVLDFCKDVERIPVEQGFV